jgi:cytohesin
MTGAPAFFQAPATNQVLKEIMRLAPPADAYEACLVGDLKRARSFLEKNPGAIRETDTPWTLLHAAAYSGNVELVKFLLSRGAPIDAEAHTKYRNTPLQTAMLSKQAAVARVLVEAGADVNHPQWEGGRALHDAVWQGNVELVRFFLSHGAKADVRDRRGETPLHDAARQGNVEMVQFLLSHGADVNARTVRGETPATWARKYGHPELAAMLEKLAAAEPDKSDSKSAN